MANTKEIRRRIKSIRNTAQITKAMQMVAASKMRRAQQQALAGRPYATVMNKVFVSLQKRTDPKLHPLLQVREVKKELVIVISTDKGLAGALNTNLLREAARFDPARTGYVVAGRKARQFLARTAIRCSATCSNQRPKRCSISCCLIMSNTKFSRMSWTRVLPNTVRAWLR